MRRYILAPAAARDLVEIWRFIKKESSVDTADRVEAKIREKIVLLSKMSDMGHLRRDLTHAEVKFFPVFSYLIVYRPETKPLQIAAILHGARDVSHLLPKTIALASSFRRHRCLLTTPKLQMVRIGFDGNGLAVAWLRFSGYALGESPLNSVVT